MTEVRDEDRSMIEMVAEAIWDSQAPEGAPPYHHLNNMEKFQISLIARDCIKAMRELPESILTREGIHTNCHMCGGYQEGWQKIIDAVLEEN